MAAVVSVAAVLVAIWVVLRVWHWVRAGKIRAFVYDEQEPPLVTTMDIATQLKQV